MVWEKLHQNAVYAAVNAMLLCSVSNNRVTQQGIRMTMHLASYLYESNHACVCKQAPARFGDTSF